MEPTSETIISEEPSSETIMESKVSELVVVVVSFP